MDNMSLSDIAAVTRNVDGDGWGAGGGWHSERDPVSGWCGRAWRGCFCYYHCRDE